MRMRFKPYAAGELAACSFCAANPSAQRGLWHAQFARPAQPLHLELGCGKGGFLAQLGPENPGVNYLGVDLTDKVLVVAKRKLEQAYAAQSLPADNVRLAAFDIERIAGVFSPEDTVQRIYINFCNPWNRKAGHTKHRLTHVRQLLQYREFLAPDGEIWFKCDEPGLFADTLGYLPAAGFVVEWHTSNLHADEPAWNRRTEHEQMYAAEGLPIYALIATKQEKLP